MNLEIKAEWLKRLRSGEYKQGKMRLKSINNKYCCLGVLCEIAKEQGIVKEVHNYVIGFAATDNSDDISDDVLPEAIVTWAELKSENPEVDNKDFPSLAELNDNDYSFEQIANIIEEQL